ncbi:amidase [Mesorhizobium sp. A623]
MTTPLQVPGGASALVEKRLAATEALNDRLRAMITVTADDARRVAAEQDAKSAAGRWSGTLAGLTVSLKDVIHTAGVRTTNGSDIDRDFVPVEDAEIVRRLKVAGAIIIGKNNLHEYAYGGTTQNPFHGSCRNPWDPERIPGGSSGGSGSAVAAGMSCVSLGTDTAGSGRLPASLCGLTGLRPTSGAIPNRGVTPVSNHFDTISPMARGVIEVAAVFGAIAGHDPQDPFSSDHAIAAMPPRSGDRLDGLRIGIPTDYFFDGVDPGVEAATRAAIAKLKELGAQTRPIDLPGAADTPRFFEKLFHTDCAYEHRTTFDSHGHRLGVDTRDRLQKLGRAFTGMDYAEGMAQMRIWQWTVRAAFEGIDAIVHPTTPVVAPTLANVMGTTTATRRLAVFLYPWSLAQVPMLSMPVGLAEAGMPCGLSVVAPWWREDTLFLIGQAYQCATDWHLAQPPILRDLRL